MSGRQSAGGSGRLRLTALVARREYLRTVRRRGYIFGTILLPIGIAFLMAVSMFFSTDGFSSDGEASGTIVIVNASDVPINDFETGTAELRILGEAEATSQLEAGDISEYYLVPADFRSSGEVKRIETDAGLDIARLEDQQSNEGLLRYVILDALLREAGISPDDASRILQGFTVTAVTLEGDAVSATDIAAGVAVPIVFVAIFMISIFMTSGYLLQSVTEEKENRVVEIVLSSIPATPLMGGKIIGLGGAGLTQVAIWVVSALVAIPLLSNQVPDLGSISLDPTVLLLALAYFVLGYLAYGAIFAAIGAMAPGNREAQQYSGFLGFAAAIAAHRLVAVPHRPHLADRAGAVAVPLDGPHLDAAGPGALRVHPLVAGGCVAGQPDALRPARRLGIGAYLQGDRAAVRRPTHAQPAGWRDPLALARGGTGRDPTPLDVGSGSRLRQARTCRSPLSQTGLISLTLARAASLSLNQSALISVYATWSAGTESSGKMAAVGHSGSQAPQSMHSSGSM